MRSQFLIQSLSPFAWNFSSSLPVSIDESGSLGLAFFSEDGTPVSQTDESKELTMGGELIGLVAVTLGMGVPIAALYTYYRVRRLRSEERLAAIARGVEIPMQPELSQAAHSRRAGILLISAAVGYIITFGLIAQLQSDRDIWTVAAFGIIPLAIGLGYIFDFSLVRREARS
jgi:uncharacterized protein DUF6249